MNTPGSFSTENLRFDPTAIATIAADFRDRPNYAPQNVLRGMRQHAGALSVIACELSRWPHDTLEQAAAEDEHAGIKEQLGMVFGYAVLFSAANNLPSQDLPKLRGYAKSVSTRPNLLETHFREDYGKHDAVVLELVSEGSAYLRNSFSRYGARLLFACYGLPAHPERVPKAVEPAWSDNYASSRGRVPSPQTAQDHANQRSISRRMAAWGVPSTIRA